MTVKELKEQLEWFDGSCLVLIPSPTGGRYSPDSVGEDTDEPECYIH